MTRTKHENDELWALSIVPNNASLVSYKEVRIKIRTAHGKYRYKNKLEVIFKRGNEYFKTYIGR